MALPSPLITRSSDRLGGTPLYLFLPWTRTPAPRRLLFWLRYHAIGFGGNSSVCDAIMTSDTLRFTASSAAR